MLQDWSSFVALEGEESLPVNNDMVDLTAVLREDIMLVLPQHPVCDQGCKGLLPEVGIEPQLDGGEGNEISSPWNALDHFKLEKDKD